jgi:hypothetical protein
MERKAFSINTKNSCQNKNEMIEKKIELLKKSFNFFTFDVTPFEDGEVVTVSVEELFLSIHFLVNSGLDDLANRPREEVLGRGHRDQLVGVDTSRRDPGKGPFAAVLRERHFDLEEEICFVGPKLKQP